MSVMSVDKYEAYTREFGLKSVMKPAPDRTVRGIGGRRKATVLTSIQIPVVDLGAVMDVEFLIIGEDVPSLLSLTDMYQNGMEFSIQNKEITLGTRKKKLAF